MKKSKGVRKIRKNEFFPILAIVIFCFLVMLITTAYAFFSYYRSGKKQSVIFTADLNILVDDNGELGIQQDAAFPVYDEVGRNTKPYKFTLKNLGTVAANYIMKLVPDEEGIAEDGCQDILLSENSVKMQLIKDGKVVKEALISELQDYQIDSGFIGLVEGVNKSYDYELRLWIPSTAGAEVMNKHYHGRIDVVVIDPANS